MKKQQIPIHATLVHDGPSLRIYQRQQEMFDGSYKTFELAERNDVVKVVLIDNEDIIMLHEEQPWLTKTGFAGWFVENWEDHFIAAQREVLEETGYNIDDMELWFSSEYWNRVRWARYYYIARSPKYIQQPNLENGEKITIIKKTFDEFLDYIASDECFDELSSYIFKKYIINNNIEWLRKYLLW